MGKSAFNKLAEQYIVTKNAVNKEVSRQLEVIVAETTDGDDMDEIALKLKAMLKGYREIRTDLTTDAEAIEEMGVLPDKAFDKFWEIHHSWFARDLLDYISSQLNSWFIVMRQGL